MGQVSTAYVPVSQWCYCNAWVNTHRHTADVYSASSEPKLFPWSRVPGVRNRVQAGRRLPLRCIRKAVWRWSEQSGCTSIPGCLLVRESVSLPSLYVRVCARVRWRRLFISPLHTLRVRVLSSYRWSACKSHQFPRLSQRRSERERVITSHSPDAHFISACSRQQTPNAFSEIADEPVLINK